MDRRSFLKALVAVGATAAVATDLIERNYAGNLPWQGYRLFPLDSHGLLRGYTVIGSEEASRAATFSLYRSDNGLPLFTCAFNAYGGMIRWIPRLGDEIVLTRTIPLDIRHDFDGAVALEIWSPSKGNQSLYFPLSRHRPTDLPMLIERNAPQSALTLDS